MEPDISLNRIEAGRGRTVLFVPGWSQSARMFHKQVEDLQRDHHVIALDMRGHGDSPKPTSGYRIARLALDLHQFIVANDLFDIVIAGHSMGASILWSYIEQFGADRIGKLIFIDQAPVVTNATGLSGDELKRAGAAFTPETLYATGNGVAAAQASVLDALKPAFFSGSITDAEVQFNKAETMKMPAAYASRLLIDHGSQDWRDVITELLPKLKVPTLVVAGGLGTIFPPESQQWVADQIPGAQLVTFSAEEHGSHFMFYENPTKFNELVRTFAK